MKKILTFIILTLIVIVGFSQVTYNTVLAKESLTVGSDADNHDGTVNFVASDGDLINVAINTDDQLGIM